MIRAMTPISARRQLLAAVAAVAASTLLAGCSSASSGASSPGSASGTSSSTSALTGQITVLAAASLTGSFTSLGKQFEAAHPGTKVVFSFGASSTLATQATSGAPADVFASASTKNMDSVVAAKAAGTPTTFAKNVMEIAVPPANPGHITQLSDLARPGVKVVLCAAAVPCGSTARKVFTNAKITVTPVSNEVDVKATLSKVQLGEADAGVVYVTDVLAAGTKVKGITIPADVEASTSYPIATLTATKNPDLAKAFVDYVLSADGQSVLSAAGFASP
jgi:molybdate transport system substrate-binding protein